MANEKASGTKRYLIYVTRYDIITNGRTTDVYEYEGDVFHAMGEIDFRSECKIYRMNYSEYTDVKAKFWTEDMGIKIHRWIDKYKY